MRTTAEISAAQENPFADFMHWELSAYHVIYDICDDHADHEEGLGTGNFPISSAPLPHPFCTCLWYVDTDKSLETIARELYQWEQGGSNAALDRVFGEWKASEGFTSKAINDKMMWREAAFQDDALLKYHYTKHEDEFYGMTEQEYVHAARELLTTDEGSDVKRLVRSDGSVSKYRVSTNEFAVGNVDGSIRTYFIPTKGAGYWDEELDRNK